MEKVWQALKEGKKIDLEKFDEFYNKVEMDHVTGRINLKRSEHLYLIYMREIVHMMDYLDKEEETKNERRNKKNNS